MDSKPIFLDGEGSFFSRSPARLEKKLQKIFALVLESKDSFSPSLRHIFVSELAFLESPMDSRVFQSSFGFPILPVQLPIAHSYILCNYCVLDSLEASV